MPTGQAADAQSDVESMPSVIAAFDIGSNSIKMTVARRKNGGIEEIAKRSETARLGQGVDASGELAGDRMAAALDALERFVKVAREAGAGRLIGVATEATRTARNGQAFLDRVRDQTGIELTAISGEREAELTFLGLDGVIDLTGDVVVADIGGGSTEVIAAKDRAVRWSASFPLGSGRLTERLVANDPPTRTELDRCRQEAQRQLGAAPLDRASRPRLFITGGTGEYVFRLIPASVAADAAAIGGVLDLLAMISSTELAEGLSIAQARAKVLPAGVAVVRAVIDLANPSSIQAAQSGIRRGLLLAAFAGTI